jgi:hypothetical protein
MRCDAHSFISGQSHPGAQASCLSSLRHRTRGPSWQDRRVEALGVAVCIGSAMLAGRSSRNRSRRRRSGRLLTLDEAEPRLRRVRIPSTKLPDWQADSRRANSLSFLPVAGSSRTSDPRRRSRCGALTQDGARRPKPTTRSPRRPARSADRAGVARRRRNRSASSGTYSECT